MSALIEYPFHLGESMDLLFNGEKIRDTGAFVDGETFQCEFYQAVGDKRGPLIAAIPAVDITYRTASDGNYKGTIVPTNEILANLKEGGVYYLRMFGGSSPGVTVERSLRIRVAYRGAT